MPRESGSYRICNRCLMDTSDPDIVFDGQGRCNHCTGYLECLAKRTYQGATSDAALAEVIRTIKEAGRGRPYDCVLGVSGGIDSSYAAYVLKTLGLRTLCVHMDNGWDSEVSVKNIKHIVTKLGFDYESWVLDWDEFKDLQVSFLKASVPEAETPTDIAIQQVVYGTAKRHGVKFIVSGGNNATEGILPKAWHYDAKDVTYLNAIHDRFGSRPLRTFPTFGFLRGTFYKLAGYRTLYLLNYVPYSKRLAMEVLERELGWRYYGGKHYESKYTGFVQSFILYEKFNIDYRRSTLSSQICAGEVTREQALKELVGKPYDLAKVEEEKRYICKKLDLPPEEFERIMKEPPKSFKDYPNSKAFLDFIYRTYRRLNFRQY